MFISAILPMKGNSERVPGKNLKHFNGSPLYSIILNTLLRSEYIENVIIDTDCEEIASNINDNFTKERITIIKRPAELVGDFVSMNDIIAYDISQAKSDFFIQTHSTNPLLRTQTINSAIKYFFDHRNKYDSVFSVTKLLTRLYDDKGVPINHKIDELIRTQDLPPVYEENSNFYIFSRESFYNARNKRIGLSPGMYEINKLEAIDIDTPEDFLLAESLHQIMVEKNDIKEKA